MAYILSASHSGSTLLAMLLGAHPEACTIGEMRASSIEDTEHYLCSCGRRIKECEFWVKVSQAMKSKGIADFDITNAGTNIFDASSPYVHRLLDPLQRGPLLEMARDSALACSKDWHRHLKTVQDRHAALVEVLQELTGAKIIIDSSKSVIHLKYLLRQPSLEIKIVRLIRDGRAVALSLIGHGFKLATRRETIAVSTRKWRRSNEAAECLLSLLPRSQWIQVQYEDLCREPEAVLRRICDFLGLETGRLNLDFRARQQHIIGNDMRLKTTSEIRLDERWRTELSGEDLAAFDMEGGKMNREFGYG